MKKSLQIKKALPLVAVLCTAQFCGMAFAQPPGDPATAPAPVPRPAPPKGPPLTPAQIQQMAEQKFELRTLNIRRELTRQNFTDPAVQAAVVDYFKAQYAQLPKLSDEYDAIIAMMNDDHAGDVELAAKLAEFRGDIQKEKARRAAALQALTDQLGLNKNPRLDLILLITGSVGEERTVVPEIDQIASFISMTLSWGDFGMGGMMGGADGFGFLGNMMDAVPKPTPEEAKKRAEVHAKRIRSELAKKGVTDVGIQNAIVEYEAANQSADIDLTTKYTNIIAGFSKNIVTDNQLAGQVNEFRSFVEDEMDRREQALPELRKKLNLDTNPRLDALLMSLGITGAERSIVQQKDPGAGLEAMMRGEIADAEEEKADGK